ncbi:MAG TPA: histidine phosphatase family protein [Stellaceae bacterium]
MTTFHILRHGEHTLQGKIVAGRTPGIGLSERGRAEAEAAAARLTAANIAAIYASPLQRAQETAHIVAERLGLDIATCDDLNEVDFGDWTGSTFAAIRETTHYPAWANRRSLAIIPGGETMRNVQRRFVETLMDLHAAHPDDALILVSHGDPIRAALSFALGMPLDYLTRIEIATGSTSTIRIDTTGIRVTGLNDRVRS